MLIPGVISHVTNVVEHPELVCERLVRLAELVGPRAGDRRHRLRLRAGALRPPCPPVDHVGEAPSPSSRGRRWPRSSCGPERSDVDERAERANGPSGRERRTMSERMARAAGSGGSMSSLEQTAHRPSWRWPTGSCGRPSPPSTDEAARGAGSCTPAGCGTATSLVGWIATGPTPVKRANLEASPFVSVTYWTADHDTCTAECAATWAFDDETRRSGLAAVPGRAGAGRLRPGHRARLGGRADLARLRRAATRAVAAAGHARLGDARPGWRDPQVDRLTRSSGLAPCPDRPCRSPIAVPFGT